MKRNKHIQLYIFAVIGYLTVAIIGICVFYYAYQGIISTWFNRG